ncbi:MAG: hypothetical protein PHD82_03380 [Candidatus Riflebacteria bacterium]|nr:hypothetical protein [Candidatus Riflebacteria bacterium]
MNQQELRDYLKKNKTVAFGVPLIVAVLLVDMLILKPARLAKKQQASGTTTAQTQTQVTTAVAPSAATNAKAPIAAPEPIVAPVYPGLSTKIESRFAANQVYPYEGGRNVFIAKEKASVLIVETGEEVAEQVIERPDISYHGFFTLGADKVAILKLADELLLTRLGATLKRTTFSLTSVLPDKIVISDNSDGIRDFEVSLSQKAEDK